MKNFSELTPEDINQAFEAADEMGANEESYFFQDDTHCLFVSLLRDGFVAQVKRRSAREYKPCEPQKTLGDAYELALEMIDANEL